MDKYQATIQSYVALARQTGIEPMYVCDIETYGTSAGSEVFAFALVPIHPDLEQVLKHTIHLEIDDSKGTRDHQTISWWHSIDSDYSIRGLISETGEGPQPMTDIPFIPKDVYIVGNGVDFDKVHTESALYRCGAEPSAYWHYRSWLDLPTLIFDSKHGKDNKANQKEALKLSVHYAHHPVYDGLLEASLYVTRNTKVSMEHWEKYLTQSINPAFSAWLKSKGAL